MLAGRKSISGKPVAHVTHADLGVGLAANTVESSGKKRAQPGTGSKPGLSSELDDRHSPSRSQDGARTGPALRRALLLLHTGDGRGL